MRSAVRRNPRALVPARVAHGRLISIKASAHPWAIACLARFMSSCAEDMQIARALLILLIAFSLAMSPRAAAFASTSTNAGFSTSQHESHCAHHGSQNRPDDQPDHTGCAMTCAAMCWGQSIAAAPSEALALRPGTPIAPRMRDDPLSSREATPPLRPPRV